MKRNIKSRKIWFSLIISIIFILFIVGAVYVSDYYHADEKSIAAFPKSGTVEVDRTQNGMIIYTPAQAEAGLIFYPGGKVEYTAYEPLMLSLAEEGILCILPDMPLNLAVLDSNAADGLQDLFPQIETWYMGGHSLGGSMAALYLSEHYEAFDGLILLGSYSTIDISQRDLNVISVYGSEDGVINRENYENSKSNLPSGFKEYVIDGGCHAYFGMYGNQEGDGTPTISNTEQIEITTDKIIEGIRHSF